MQFLSRNKLNYNNDKSSRLRTLIEDPNMEDASRSNERNDTISEEKSKGITENYITNVVQQDIDQETNIDDENNDDDGNLAMEEDHES